MLSAFDANNLAKTTRILEAVLIIITQFALIVAIVMGLNSLYFSTDYFEVIKYMSFNIYLFVIFIFLEGVRG